MCLVHCRPGCVPGFLVYTLLCSFAGCRCWAPAPGAAALAALLRLALVCGRFGVFASSWLWGAFCRWPCPVLGFLLVFRFAMGYTLPCSFAGCRCWPPAPGAAALAGLLRLALVYGRFGVFASSWLWGAFCRWPCPFLGFPLVFRFVMGYTLLCSFAGCRCWAPAPGVAALAGLLRFALVYSRFGVFASSWLWGAFCRWPCPVLGFPLVFRFVMGYTLLCSFAGCRCWAPAPGAAALAGLLRLALVYGRFGVFASSWLWGAFCRWPCPLLGFPLVFRFVMGYILLCSFGGCRCWAPAPGAAALAGLLRLALVYGRFGVFASSWLWGAFCRWPCPLLGFPLVFRFVMGYTLLCSFAGCRCWAPAPGVAALAGLLRLALVYGRFGVFASSWLWGAFCRWPCPVLGFPLVFRFVMGYILLCSFAGCRCWAPAPGAAALAGLLRLALVYGRFGVFASSWLWGAFCRWPCPLLGFPLVFRFVMGYILLCSFAGCRCWACSRRCGSCRPPEVSFCLLLF